MLVSSLSTYEVKPFQPYYSSIQTRQILIDNVASTQPRTLGRLWVFQPHHSSIQTDLISTNFKHGYLPPVLNGGKSPIKWGGQQLTFAAVRQLLYGNLFLREISVGTAVGYPRAKAHRGHVYTGMNYGSPLRTTHPYSQIINQGILHGYDDAYAYGATSTHMFNEIEPEYFDINKEHYHYACSEFLQQFMPPKEKRGPYSGYRRLANFE